MGGDQPINPVLSELSKHERQRVLLEKLTEPTLPTVAHTDEKTKGKFIDPKEKQFIPLYYSIIKDHSMTLTERLLFALINSLDQSDSHCYAKNSYLADLIGVSDRQIRKMISSLEVLGKIEILGRTKNRRVIKSLLNEKKKS